MLEQLARLIIDAGIVHGVFAVVLFAGKKRTSVPSLIPLVICFSLIISHGFYFGDVVGDHIQTPFIIAEPFLFLISPLLFFHFRKIVHEEIRFSWVDLIHFLPFLLFFLSFIPTNFFGQETLYFKFLYSNPLVLTVFVWVGLILQFLNYLPKLTGLNRQYVQRLESTQSDYHDYDASWIKTFMIIFLMILVLLMVVLTGIIHAGTFDHFSLIIPSFFSVMLYVITYKALNQRRLETVKEVKEIQEGSMIDLTEKKSQLEQFMTEQQSFLNSELTLNDLAQQFGMSRNQLSHLINQGFEMNFYLFINNYRVRHVKTLMKEDSNQQYTLLALALDSGFTSKSSFNMIFKKITGLTPSEYRAGLN
ncbi:MAG: AraC family transcriptional regulator [Cyclobacteriaceae bacterium]